MDSEKEKRLVFVDGRDSLATVIVKPNAAGNGVLIEAFVNGISKGQGAAILRHVADTWASESREEAGKS